jgi:UDP-N-acetylmuramate: L-alanyl-gamma-D-glutamyl-meso-diaminopimelate ligase
LKKNAIFNRLMDTAKHVHVLGICGTAMASLAGLLKESGFRVTGSDANAYPPMSTQLEELGIEVMKGYDRSHLDPRPDFVIVGNVCRRDNAEAVAAMDMGIPYHSMPSFLEENYLPGRHSVVVAGTHGKTTTTSMIAWILKNAGMEPSYLVGGIPLNFGRSSGFGAGPHFVIEGDEYDTAFFDKGPKFLHYRPQTAIITSVEFDHADIYRDFDHYRYSFEKFVSIIPGDGVLLAADDPEVTRVIRGAVCRVIRYGRHGSVSGWTFKDPVLVQEKTAFQLYSGDFRAGEIRMNLPGMHNIWNATAAAGTCIELGLPFDEVASAMASFRGVARRQQHRGTYGGITVIDDFAHHPTAVAETIGGVRAKYLDGSHGRLVAVFEPRSNSSRRNVFQDRYAGAFSGADLAVVSAPFSAASLGEEERLDHQKLCAEIENSGVKAVPLAGADAIVDFLHSELRDGDVVLVMSNGSFDGLVAKLTGRLDGSAGRS